jgi:L-ribulose-5-phosphate 3-epimerase
MEIRSSSASGNSASPLEARLGACTWAYVWRTGIEECLGALAARGYRTMDVLTIPPHPFPSYLGDAGRSSLAALLRREGLVIETLNIPSTDVNLCSVNRDMRIYTVDQIRRTLELASDLAVPMVTTVPGRRLNFNAPAMDMTIGWLTGCLEELLPAAEALGVDILLELHPQSCLPDTRSLTTFLDRLGSGKLGIALDVANAAFVGDDPAQAIHLAAPWLRQVHLSDTPRGKWHHDVVGTGDMDFAAIFSAMTQIGYRGTSIVEITCDDPDGGFSLSRTRLEAFGWRV